MRIQPFLTVITFALLFSFPTFAVDDYTPGPDAQVKAGVPQGKMETFTFTNSAVYAETSREVSVYIPAQYDATKPAALMVFQDGQSYANKNGQIRATIVFDNLIRARDMPVTIGIFISPGNREGAVAGARSNRSFEYDSLGDAYSKFLINELIPHVKEKFQLNLSTDPKMRAICGMSSGAICAFTVAWERPDYFQKVLSHIGSYVNIRGGHVYPALIRKTERKPIRIFLQEGRNDLNNLHGNWPLANQEMASALGFAGYDYRFELGDGAHNGKHAGAILPESLRWLWRNESVNPDPLTKDNFPGDEALSKILPKDSDWELVAEGLGFGDGACSDAEGNFYVSDLPNGAILKITPQKETMKWLERGPKISGLKMGADGKFYAATQGDTGPGASNKKKIIAIDPTSKQITDISVGVEPNDLAVSAKGWIYYTDTGAGQVMMVPTMAKDMSPKVAVGGIKQPNGITLSPDQKVLVVSEYGGTNAWSYVIDEEGNLRGGERFMTLTVPTGRPDSGGDGMTVDAQSRYFITSHAGIQVFDVTGRLGGVIAKPGEKGSVSVAFAGSGNQFLYACAGDKIYRRKMIVAGPPLRGER